MSHLGRWLSALVDGELDSAERDRILIHIAGCSPCRREVNELRALKRRMTKLSDAEAAANTEAEISGRLIDLARADESWPPDLAWPSADRPPGLLTGRASRSARHRINPGVKVAGAALAVTLGAIGVTAFLVGGDRSPSAPKITPAVDIYWGQHDYDTGQVPAGPQRVVRHTVSRPAVHSGSP